MNRLFERFILVQLLRAQRQSNDRQIQIEGQASKAFWATKTIRPDIIIRDRVNLAKPGFILDTKWKIPVSDQPSDEDLKQMYAYNLHFGAPHSLLLYPRADSAQVDKQNAYSRSVSLPDYTHGCGTHFIELFNSNQLLRTDIGIQLLAHINDQWTT